MQERIDRLESLVTSLIGQNKADSPPRERDCMPNLLKTLNGTAVFDEDVLTEVQHGMGVMTVDGTASMYRGTTHWYDVLKEVRFVQPFKPRGSGELT